MSEHQTSTLMEALQSVQRAAASDFAALAPITGGQPRIQWKMAAGNRNERYAHMVVKAGQGLAGEVLRHGKWAKLDEGGALAAGQLLRCPLMLAEQLLAAAVFPIPDPGGSAQPLGLVYVGRRQADSYTPNDVAKIEAILPEFACILKVNQQHISK
ncbi:hypothetical protein ABE504_20675 [Paenibacillus oryzisoli]|uniref:hypothetical protein n=1 Tax=Paenibacillus oryzisoli TaxID=1850517 RepID=UPI003D287DE8